MMIKSSRMEWVGSMAEMRHTYKMLVGKHEGKRPLGRPRRRWEDKTGMDVGKMCTGYI
jgi:hypothetical protein